MVVDTLDRLEIHIFRDDSKGILQFYGLNTAVRLFKVELNHFNYNDVKYDTGIGHVLVTGSSDGDFTK